MPNCEHPTDRCATCGLSVDDPRGHPTDYSPPSIVPDGRHAPSPAPCGEALVSEVARELVEARDPHHMGGAIITETWRCPIHGEAEGGTVNYSTS